MRFLYVIIFFFVLTQLSGQVDLNEGLVGYYNLDGNAQDLSSQTIHGTEYNTIPIFGIDSIFASAMYFNGQNAYIDCGTNNRQIDDAVTVSAWVKTTETKDMFVVCKYDWRIDRGFRIFLRDGSAVFSGRNNSGEYIETDLSITKVNDNQWHHLLGVQYQNTWQVWVDCQLEAQTFSNSSDPSLVSFEPLTIGNYNLGVIGDEKYFDGSIDEVRIYNRLLNIEEIDSLCQLPERSDCEYYYIMDNGISGIDTIIFTKDEFSMWDMMDTTICVGDSIYFAGKWIGQPGQYLDTLHSKDQGCDSLITELDVSVFPEASEEMWEEYICYDETITIGNNTIIDDTLIIDTIFYKGSMCDSLHQYIQYHRLPEALIIEIDTLLCPAEFVTIQGHTLDTEGQHQIELKDLNECDSLIYDINLSYLPEAVSISIDTVLCEGDSIRFKDEWIYEDFVNQESIVYKGFICDSVQIDYSINFSAFPELISADTYELKEGEELNLDLQFNQEVESIEWHPSEGLSCDNCLDPLIRIEQSMLYEIIVTNDNGCRSVFQIEVELREVLKEEEIYIPNIINISDPVNDRFYIQTSVNNEVDYNMYIYDRWGNLVFVGEGLPTNDKESGWDGTMNSKPLLDGVYVYLIEIPEQDNLKIAGDVVVVR